VKQELFTLPEIIFCIMLCRSLFVLFRLAVDLSVLLRFTASDYTFGVFKILLLKNSNNVSKVQYEK